MVTTVDPFRSEFLNFSKAFEREGIFCKENFFFLSQHFSFKNFFLIFFLEIFFQ